MINMAALPLKSSSIEQHAVVATVDSLGQPGVRGVTTSTIQPDLAANDYYLFGPMKKMLSGQKFASDMEVQWAVHQQLVEQPTSYFASGIHKNC